MSINIEEMQASDAEGDLGFLAEVDSKYPPDSRSIYSWTLKQDSREGLA